MDAAARARDNVRTIEMDRLHATRKNGRISSNMTDGHLENYAARVGYTAQVTHIGHNPPSRDTIRYLKVQVSNAENAKGAAWSNKYGHIRTGVAKQRGDNTRLTSVDADDDTDIDAGVNTMFNSQMAAAKVASLQ